MCALSCSHNFSREFGLCTDALRAANGTVGSLVDHAEIRRLARLASHATSERLSGAPAAATTTLEAVSSYTVPLTLGVAATGESTNTRAGVGSGDGCRSRSWDRSRSRSRLVLGLGDEDAAGVGLRRGRARSRLWRRRGWLGNGDRSRACAYGRSEDIRSTVEPSNFASRVGKLDISAFLGTTSISNVGNEHIGQRVDEAARAA